MNARILYPVLSAVFLFACSAGDDGDGRTNPLEGTGEKGDAESGTGKGEGGGDTRDAAPPPTSDGGLAPFGGVCAKNEDCETGYCGNFNKKGMRCTKTCQSDTECPNPPGLGCNNQTPRICKVP